MTVSIVLLRWTSEAGKITDGEGDETREDEGKGRKTEGLRRDFWVGDGTYWVD